MDADAQPFGVRGSERPAKGGTRAVRARKLRLSIHVPLAAKRPQAQPPAPASSVTSTQTLP